MKRGTSRHSKLLMLACELDIDTYAAVGLACCMWDWVGETMPQGNIGSAPDRIIAQVVGWRGDPAKLVQAMVKVGLLDVHPTHRLVVHDWSEHSDDGVHTFLWRRRAWFADGKAPRTRHLNSGERDKAEEFYESATNPPQSECGENVATPHESRIAKADGTDRNEPERTGTERTGTTLPQPPKGGGIDEIKQGSPTDGKRHKATRTRKATEAATLAQVAYVFEGRGFAGVEFANALEAFYGHRNEIGHPMTLRAASAMVTQFANLTEREATECLVQSVANGWRGVFPEKVRRSGPAAVAAANRGGVSSIDSVIAEAQRLRELEERRTA